MNNKDKKIDKNYQCCTYFNTSEAKRKITAKTERDNSLYTLPCEYV